MSYVSNIGEGSFDVGLGCGPTCKCGPCKSGLNGFAEWYEREEVDEPPKVIAPRVSSPRQPSNLTRSGSSFRSAQNGVEGFGQPGSPTQPIVPVFAHQCPVPPGCPPVAAGQCVAVLREAIIEAIKLAENAATKIEAAIKTEPSKRDDEAKNTAGLFTFFFGHDPLLRIPRDGNQASGVSVAFRFRAVAKALRKGGRNTLFRCALTRTDCNASVRPPIPGTVNPEPNVVNLCASFWDPPPGLRGLSPPYFRAAVIIHEMLHLLFYQFLLHNPPGRPNAHCYEAFCLRVAGFGADRIDVKACFSKPKSPLQKRMEEAWNRLHPSPNLTPPF